MDGRRNNHGHQQRVKRPVAEVERARDLAGGTVALAVIAGVSSQMVSQWLSGLKPVSPHAAVAIELALAVPADGLCDLVPWRLLPVIERVREMRRAQPDRVVRGRRAGKGRKSGLTVRADV
jgi:DNA-binding transcriptional regulator YdaS (Cro superfamily)